MAIVYTDTIEPRKPTQEITLGTTGETITLPGNDLRVNTVKDKGGNTLWTSDGSGTLSSVNAGLKGNLVLLTTNTFTGASSSEFTSKIDSTYDVYIFKLYDINPSANLAEIRFQVSSTGAAPYGMTITSTAWHAYNHESSGAEGLEYQTGQDLAQSTDPQQLCNGLGNLADESLAGEMHLFAPSSTTYMKHFYSRCQFYHGSDYSEDFFIAGYINEPLAVNAIQFTMDSGTFDGTIKMYGLL